MMSWITIPRAPGVYFLSNMTKGRTYVGSTKNLYQRLKDHFNRLHGNIHYSKELESDYHTGDEFLINFIQLPTKEEAQEAEQGILKAFFDSGKLYNKAQDAYLPGLGKIVSEEERRKTSERFKGNTWGLGRVHTEESRMKMSIAMKGRKFSEEHKLKLSERKVKPIEINGVIYQSNKEAAERLGVTIDIVKGRIDSKNFPDWKRIGSKKERTFKNVEAFKTKISLAKQYPVEIEKIVYRNALEASRQLGISKDIVEYRLKRPNFPDWKRLPKEPSDE